MQAVVCWLSRGRWDVSPCREFCRGNSDKCLSKEEHRRAMENPKDYPLDRESVSNFWKSSFLSVFGIWSLDAGPESFIVCFCFSDWTMGNRRPYWGKCCVWWAVRTTVWGISVRAASVATSCCKGSVRSKCIRKLALSIIVLQYFIRCLSLYSFGVQYICNILFNWSVKS